MISLYISLHLFYVFRRCVCVLVMLLETLSISFASRLYIDGRYGGPQWHQMGLNFRTTRRQIKHSIILCSNMFVLTTYKHTFTYNTWNFVSLLTPHSLRCVHNRKFLTLSLCVLQLVRHFLLSLCMLLSRFGSGWELNKTNIRLTNLSE